MATKEAIGIKRELATGRIQKDVNRLVDLFGLNPNDFDLEPFDRDPELKHAMQLEGFADFLEKLSEAHVAQDLAHCEKIQEMQSALDAAATTPAATTPAATTPAATTPADATPGKK